MEQEKLAKYDLKNVEYEELFNSLEFKLKEMFSGLLADTESPCYIVFVRKNCLKKEIVIDGKPYTQIVLPIRVCSYDSDAWSSMILKVSPFGVEIDGIGDVRELNSVLRTFMMRKFPESGYTQDYIDFSNSADEENTIH